MPTASIKVFSPILTPRDGDFFFIEEEDPQDIVELIKGLVKERLPRYLSCDPIEDIQVLSPMRRTTTGVDNLNAVLQEALNPSRPHQRGSSFGKSSVPGRG